MCESGERWVEGHLGDAALTISYAPPTWSTTVCVITSRPTHSDEQRGACALDDELAPERAVCTLPPESRIQCGFGPVGGAVEFAPESGVGCSRARPEARETAAEDSEEEKEEKEEGGEEEGGEAPVAAETGGVQLHLSSSNATGYKGVYEHRSSGRFWAQRRVGGKLVYLGSFDSAVEAAVAYARAAGEAGGGEDAAELAGKHEECGGEAGGRSGGGEVERPFEVGGRCAIRCSGASLGAAAVNSASSHPLVGEQVLRRRLVPGRGRGL